MLTDADVCSMRVLAPDPDLSVECSMLTYANVCWCMLTYADVCLRMLTDAYVCSMRVLAPDPDLSVEWLPKMEQVFILTVSIRQHTSAYVRIRQHT
jgi:hypothetical protein